jgi:lipopolysaccharide export system protein LptA
MPGSSLLLWLVGAVTSPQAADIQLAPSDPSLPLVVSASQAWRWQDGAEQAWVLRGDCVVRQGSHSVRADQMVLWLRRPEATRFQPLEAVVYGEGNVSLNRNGSDPSREEALAVVQSGGWVGRFQSESGAQLEVDRTEPLTAARPAVYGRAVTATRRNPGRSDRAVAPAQFAEPLPAAPGAPAPARRIEVRPRGSAGYRSRSFRRGEEFITLVDAGVLIRIFGYLSDDVVEIATDRLVVWSRGEGLDFSAGSAADQPVEFYMEGNIVFRQGEQVVTAERMYYNVQGEYGVILEAELLARIPGYDGAVRLKADVLRQFDRHRYRAEDAALTTSRLGVPGYWVQTESLQFENYAPSSASFPVESPLAGSLLEEGGRQTVSAQGTAVFLGGWPVFYWPSFATDLGEPTLYLDSFNVNSDSVFGTQLLARWNLFQVLGIRQPPDINWTLSTDYLSDRGFALGTNVDYQRDQLLGRPYWNQGLLDAWFIQDSGLDNLGQLRRALPPTEETRGRLLARHRHRTPGGYQLTGEAGWVSDANFLEQYYEREWDQEKDQVTQLELKRLLGNASWNVTGAVRVNEFFTQTQWARFDHFRLGQPLLGQRLTWHEHTHVGFGQLKVADLSQIPSGGLDLQLLPWEVPAQGLRAASRQEVDLPLQLGPVRVVPYLLGEAAYWQEDIQFDETTRLLGQTGVRASLPMTRVDPTRQSPLFNLNGLAHKVVFEAELLYADASQNLEQFPLYDPIDDDSVEFFLRTLEDIPLRYDSRNYAYRHGMQRWIAAPGTEIVDDLTALRLGTRQRWQTRRGLPGQQRTVDWLTLDVESWYYPRSAQNFSQELGPLSYDMKWHVGDRTTLLSDGYFDFFGQGLRTLSVGGLLSRPGRSQYLLNLRSIEGPISSNVVTSAVSTRISPKWILNYGSTYDFSRAGNIGQIANVVRVGESFLVSLGVNYDRGRDNLGVRMAIEPRFYTSRLGRIAGAAIPPVGAYGIE